MHEWTSSKVVLSVVSFAKADHPPHFFFFFFSSIWNFLYAFLFLFLSLSAFSFFPRPSQSRCLDILSPATAIFIDVVVGDLFVFSPPSCPHSVADITHTGNSWLRFLREWRRSKWWWHSFMRSIRCYGMSSVCIFQLGIGIGWQARRDPQLRKKKDGGVGRDVCVIWSGNR